ncbi:hypothetical protein B0T22DRAFT_485748 [Podospora appendiculata]|uniref:FAD-binding PCMH-type domain-containing protein n=1 Tax=Podospora appendiculata TaxID=314037 RepID=A0AAE0WYS8_9PEZI|nr:hypothetical protein B0T22DRAFT_485748 [Podospora appendiculata]
MGQKAGPGAGADQDRDRVAAATTLTLARKLAQEKKKSRRKNWLIAGIATVALAAHYYLPQQQQQHSQPTYADPVTLADPVTIGGVALPAVAAPVTRTASTLQDCLDSICAGRANCVHYAGGGGLYKYFSEWIKPLNLAYLITPAAVIRPRNVTEVAAVVKCAAKNGVKVQAKSGGHSYANYGSGGQDGAISVDLVNLQSVWVNTTGGSWQAHVGAGSKLGDVDDKLAPYKRAFAHGICPGVGIGGHATIGGLGPMSRMWGTCLDHVEEVEVVTATGAILRASTTQNVDLFWALRGAGAGFGIITEFVLKTHPEPAEVVDYVYNFQYSHLPEMVDFFMAWQNLVADPTLDRRLGTEFTLYPFGARVTATWYGSQAEFVSSGIMDRLPSGNDTVGLSRNSWLGHLLSQAQKEALRLGDVPNPFYSKSLGFTRRDLLTRAQTLDLFQWVDKAAKGTLAWFVIFDATGGKVADVGSNATAYAHRDKVFFYQSYAINVLRVSSTTRAFLEGFHNRLLGFLPAGEAHGTYPGYVDPFLKFPQQEYWLANLPVLEGIKSKWDAGDVFHNPQSVRPAVKKKGT